MVVMGVTGCGKSTVAAAFAERTGGRYVDGDSLHPQTNIDRMAAGRPLDDTHRWPWLKRVGEELRADGTILACSALKRAYRDAIRVHLGAGEAVAFLYLKGSRATLLERMAARKRHFMPVSLLDSQLRTLEEPDCEEENAVTVSIDQPVGEIVEAFIENQKISDRGGDHA